MKFKELFEGLRKHDLEYLVEPEITIDLFKSKMGEDQDVSVISFITKDRYSAKDLEKFLEKSFPYVLDADISAGENKSGNYTVFVEVQRNSSLPAQIVEMTTGVSKLTNIKDWKFSYHKQNKSNDLNENNLQQIPLTPNDYKQYQNKINENKYKSFFNKTVYNDIILNNNEITIQKENNQEIKLQIVDDLQVTEHINQDGVNNTYSVFYLTKMLGDYNITQFEDTFQFLNNGKTLYFKRS